MKFRFDDFFSSLKNNLFEFYSKNFANEIKFILCIRSENNISDELIYFDLVPEPYFEY